MTKAAVDRLDRVEDFRHRISPSKKTNNSMGHHEVASLKDRLADNANSMGRHGVVSLMDRLAVNANSTDHHEAVSLMDRLADNANSMGHHKAVSLMGRLADNANSMGLLRAGSSTASVVSTNDRPAITGSAVQIQSVLNSDSLSRARAMGSRNTKANRARNKGAVSFSGCIRATCKSGKGSV